MTVSRIESEQAQPPSFVVGIGASAGGLEALEELFEHMPIRTGMSFVVIQHLSPDYKSLMDELLARKTQIPITVAKNETKIVADHIYLLPPKHEMIVSNDLLLLKERENTKEMTYPINNFFYSLADCFQHRSIAIVLSGTGSDGTKGVIAVHDAGGFSIAQDPISCKFDAMPKNSIATKKIDIQANPKDIAGILIKYSNRTLKVQNQIELGEMDGEETRFTEIILIIKNRFGIDFSQYKPSTITRRLERRLSIQKTSSMQEYLNILLSNPEELENLYLDLLIGVTEFFRDKKYFVELKNMIPDIFKVFSQEKEIRIWTAGCASGQEAYSLSIMFYEFCLTHNIKQTYKIFATDIHKRSISKATSGVFLKNELVGLNDEQIAKYFNLKYDKYTVIPEIRKPIIFAHHNIISDPPFTKIHLLSCRNLLIYFNQRTQKSVMSLLGFSLVTGGYLFLGPSESIGTTSPYFDVITETAKIYKKTKESIRSPITEYYPLKRFDRKRETKVPSQKYQNNSNSVKKALEILLQQYVPASLLIDSEGVILRVFGNAKDYLSIDVGTPSLNIKSLVGSPAKTILAQMMHQANKTRRPVISKNIEGFRNHKYADIQVSTLSSEASDLDYFLIKFNNRNEEDRERKSESNLDFKCNMATQDYNISELEEELRFTKESLQSTVEELETTNEELQASNEELQASNEELQSTNEELHSLNEELYTVNSEYQAKEKERAELLAEEKNILQIVGLLLLDVNLRIRKYSPLTAKVFNILAGDEGRPFKALSIPDAKKMISWVESALRDDMKFEEEIKGHHGETYIVKIARNYQVDKNGEVTKGVFGVSISLIDISSRQAQHQSLQNTINQYENVLDSISDSYFEWSLSSGLFLPSQLKSDLEYLPEDNIKWADLVDSEHNTLIKGWHEPQQENHKFIFPLKLRKKSGTHTWMICKGEFKSNKATGILIDINSLKEKEKDLETAAIELQRSNKLLEEFAYIVSHDLKAPLRHIRNYLNFLNEALEEGDSEQAQEEMNNLNMSAKRLEHLVDDIITLSRFTSEKKKAEPVDLNTLMDRVCHTLSPTIKEKNIDVKISNLPIINGDVSLLEHLFQNLIANACKYNDKKNPIIKVDAKKEGGFQYIYVEDNGIGFDNDHKKMIFTPFKRLVTKDEYEGSGIGLAICKTVVEQHQGSIFAEGKPGIGAIFTVKLKG